jgi:hypothetical protein
MIYPINQAIPYTAVATTFGHHQDTFSYTWTFDDNTSSSGASVSKTWTTPGNHLATVTATDLVTNTVAVAQKNINLFNPSMTWNWYDTGKSLTTANSSFEGFETGKTFLFGNKLISFGSYYYRQDVNVYNMDTDTLTLYSSALPSGGFGGSCLIPAGPYAGKVLLFGNNSGAYGYWDLADNTYTPISATGGPGRINGVYSVPSIALNNGNIMVVWVEYTSYGNATDGYPVSIYNTSTNTFGPRGDKIINSTLQLNMLPSGNVLAVWDNSTSYNIYSQSGSLLATGTGASNFPEGPFQFGISLPDGRFLQISGSYANIFTEDTSIPSMGTWTTGVAAYPVAEQGGTGSYYSCLVLTPEGDVLEVGGEESDAGAKPYMVFYSPSINSFNIMATKQPLGNGGVIYPYSGRFWAIRDSDGRIFKSAPWIGN